MADPISVGSAERGGDRDVRLQHIGYDLQQSRLRNPFRIHAEDPDENLRGVEGCRKLTHTRI